jgi:hypothetical protein
VCPLPDDHLRKWVHKADVDTKKHSQAGWSDEDEVVKRVGTNGWYTGTRLPRI